MLTYNIAYSKDRTTVTIWQNYRKF